MRKIISLILITLLLFSVFGFNISAASKPDALVNSLYKLQSGNFTVGYFGGSVTKGVGASNEEKTSWRALTREWFKTNFPNANITEVNAAVGATGSNFGLYRAGKHLIKDKAPDLCFIESAVNDLWPNAEFLDGKNFHGTYTNMDAIIKKIYSSNPKADIVFIITGEIGCLNLDATSEVPVFGDKYTELANYYKLPIIYVGRELVRTIYAENGNVYPQDVNNAVWKKYFKDKVHPVDAGYAHYSNTIIGYLSSKLMTGYTATANDYADNYNPEITYSEQNMAGDIYLDADMICNLNELSNCSNLGFTQVGDVMRSTKDGDSIEFDFNSPNVGIWHAGGAKIEIEYSIDGGDTKYHTLYQADGTYRMFILGSNLADGNHRIKITRIGGSGNFNIQAIMLSGKPYVGKLTAYNSLPPVEMPAFRLSGVNGGTKKMNISSNTQGATIYYTLDGSDPKTSASKQTYKGAITLTKDLQIKAYAVKSGMRDSVVATFDYKTYMEGYIVTANKNDANGVSFTTNAELSKITSVKVDGQTIDKANYDILKETKTITLKPEFLQTVSVGAHTLTLVFMDGDAECSFNVVKNTTSNIEEGTAQTDDKKNESISQVDQTDKIKNKSISKETVLIIVIVVVVLTVLAAEIIVFLLIKKAKSQKKAE